QFAEPAPVFEPPTDRPRPAQRGFRGRRQRMRLAPEEVGGLETLGREHGASLFMILLAAYTALLHRWTGQDDLVVGIPVVHRPFEGGDHLIGHCVDVMPVRSRCQGTVSFADHLAAVRRRLLDAQEHNAYPFARLVRLLAPPPDPSRAPLVNTVLNLEPELTPPPAAGLEIGRETPVVDCVKFEIAVHMARAAGALELCLESRCDLFDASTTRRLLNQFQTVLRSLTQGREERMRTAIEDLPILSAGERHQVQVEWNDHAADYPREASVPELFATRAAQVPDAIAVSFGDRSLSYGQLARRADQLAGRLASRGVGPETRVGVCLEPAPEMVIALLAILRAGGAYVPLDPGFPSERLARILRDGGLALVLTEPALRERLPVSEAPVVDLFELLGRNDPTRVPRAPVRAAHLAYVMYTSGSTGEPKGVGVTHRAIVRLVMHTNYIRLRPSDRVAQLANPAFDAATFEIWGALLVGAALVGIPRATALAALIGELRRREIRVIFLATALFNQLVGEEPGALCTLRCVLFGGEAVNPEAVREALAQGPPQELLHVYGPTETTTFASWYRVRSVPPGARTVPIGRPLANSGLHVLDRRGRPLPMGWVGELAIAGDGLARGYFNRPQATAERFVPDPLSGERRYRTGDQVRLGADGNLEFLGRFDHQVKLRGFRLELGEIEAVLGEHPAVREAVVVVRDEAGDRRLAAYLVPGAGAVAPAPGELRAFLQPRLPEFMVPSAFVALTALPLSATGKIDRAALPAPDADRRDRRTAFTAPRTPVEEILSEIWRPLLGHEHIGAFGAGPDASDAATGAPGSAASLRPRAWSAPAADPAGAG
ncbi:MAG: amino acid adenylation domain-containing protein, partial [bacterium]|nr:amino acid adenylation domain-containing protein [bacterium]